MEGWSGGQTVNEGQSLLANEFHPAEVNCSGTGGVYISWAARWCSGIPLA